MKYYARDFEYYLKCFVSSDVLTEIGETLSTIIDDIRKFYVHSFSE